MKLHLPQQKVYGFFMSTADYSMRLYINGEEIDLVGIPGTNREETTPRVLERIYSFTPDTDTTVLVMQTADFTYYASMSPPLVSFGEYQVAEYVYNKNWMMLFMKIGILSGAALMHFGTFILNRARKMNLIFGLCCLSYLFLSNKAIPLLFPDYNLELVFRLEYLGKIMVFAGFWFLIHRLHPGLLNKNIVRFYFAVSGLYTIFTATLPTMVFSRWFIVYDAIAIVSTTYMALMLAVNLRKKTIESVLSFMGILVILTLGINDILFLWGISWLGIISGQTVTSIFGMVFFVFCYSLLLSLENTKTEQREQHLAEEAVILNRMNQLKTDLITTISHEARTPLAVLSSYASIVSMELRDKGIEGQAADNLDQVIFEAKRVANLIDNMKRIVLNNETGYVTGSAKRISADIGDIAEQTTGLYRHMIELQGLTLDVHIEKGLPPVYGCPEELTQVIFNLLQNAHRHTEQGKVTLTVKSDNGKIIVTIADTGTGIPAEILPRIFERGVAGRGGGSGIGLPLCKEIIETHNGAIHIDSEPDKGTTVTVTLPIYERREDDGA
jgi:signal transduction histidine kinase